MGRSIVLHLLARIEVILPGRLPGFLPDSMTAAEGRQSRVGKLGARGQQLLMDSDQIPFAGRKQLKDFLPVRLRFFRAQDRRGHD